MSKLFSALGRVNYVYNNKYILTASFRRDGVSKFLEESRYGFFPSMAFAWNMMALVTRNTGHGVF